MAEPTGSAPLLDYAPQDPRGGMIPAGMRRSLASILGPLIGLLVVIAIFGSWKPTRFLTQGNLANVLTNNYHYAVAAVGATFVIITAGIDLSVGSTLALACVCCAMTIKGVTFPAREAGTTIVAG